MRNKKVFELLMVISLVFILTSSFLACVEVQPQEWKCEPCECQVKVKQIPLPWQFWNTIEGWGVQDIIVLSDTFCEPVFIFRQWATLPVAIELNDLTWEETEMIVIAMVGNWTGSDEEPVWLHPGSQVTLDIPTTEEDAAVVLRYCVAQASNPAEVVVHIVNEALLESPQIRGQLSNFDVHNNVCCMEVDNFELEFSGNITPSDIVGWYWQGLPVVRDWQTRPWGQTLYGGWGTPPSITTIAGGIEVKWKDADYPIKSCEWVHFGLYIKAGVPPMGVQAFWTKLCECECELVPA